MMFIFALLEYNHQLAQKEPVGMFGSKVYRKNPKNMDTWKIAVINLKVEQGGFTIE